MSAAKHTPGPWFYRKGDEWSHSVVTRHGELPDGSPCYWTVASINKRREPEHEANARLIAMAPELLAAVTAAADLMEQEDFATQTLVPKLRAAIAAARGQA